MASWEGVEGRAEVWCLIVDSIALLFKAEIVHLYFIRTLYTSRRLLACIDSNTLRNTTVRCGRFSQVSMKPLETSDRPHDLPPAKARSRFALDYW